MAANPNRAPTTDKGYRDFVERYLGDWLGRPLDAIARRDVEARFNRITTQSGWATANRTISLLRSAYSRPCVDYDGLRNPVDLWLAAGGQVPSQEAAQDTVAGRGATALARGHPGRGLIAEVAGRLLVWLLHRHAPQRGAAAAMGSGRPGEADLPCRGDQDRRAAGVAGHPATGRPPRAAVGGERHPAGRLGVSVDHHRNGPISGTWRNTTSRSARPGVQSSGTTVFATPSSPSPSAI